MMHKYLVIFEKANENYSAYSPDIPGCIATGATREEAEKNIKEAINAYQQQYKQYNYEKVKTLRAQTFQKNKKSVNRYTKRKLKTDINFKLAHGLRSRLGTAIRNSYKAGSAVRDLGCTIPELRQRFEEQFQPGMSWSNWSRDGWHIDHIKPLANFNLTNRQEFLEACHSTNLRPLWAKDNLSRKKNSDNMINEHQQGVVG